MKSSVIDEAEVQRDLVKDLCDGGSQSEVRGTVSTTRRLVASVTVVEAPAAQQWASDHFAASLFAPLLDSPLLLLAEANEVIE
jgi:hypothetical protein